MGAEDFKEIVQTIRSASAINLYNIGDRLLLCKCYSSSKDQLPYRYLRNLFFFGCPTALFGHCWGETLTKSMLTTAFLIPCSTRRSLGALQGGWVTKPGQATTRVWTASSLVSLQYLNPRKCYPLFNQITSPRFLLLSFF